MELKNKNRRIREPRVPVDNESRELWQKEAPLYKNKAIAAVIDEAEQTVSDALNAYFCTETVKEKLNGFFKRHIQEAA